MFSSQPSISWKSEIYSVLRRRTWDAEMFANLPQIPQTGGVCKECSLWFETPFHKVFCKQPEDCKQSLKDIVYSSCYIKKFGTKIGSCLVEYDRDWLRKPASTRLKKKLRLWAWMPLSPLQKSKAPSKTEDASDWWWLSTKSYLCAK